MSTLVLKNIEGVGRNKRKSSLVRKSGLQEIKVGMLQ